MSFLNLSSWVVALGALGLAVGLFLLQRLRVRHRRVEVVTSLFWREAVEETRARVLVKRFRHPWAYALILAISLLLWLAIAEPALDPDRDVEHVLLLDRSAAMSREGRLDAVLERLRGDVRRLRPDRRRVYVCGARIELVLDHDEEPVLLDRRLLALEPELSASRIERALETIARSERDFERRRVVVYSDAPVDLERVEGLEVVRRSIPGAEDSPAVNRGITALGVSPARSGESDRVDVSARLEGSLRGSPALRVALDGEPIAAALERRAEGERAEDIVLRDLPAGGGTLEIALAESDDLGADDTARIVLPRRRPIRVEVGEELPAAMVAALRADSGVDVVTQGGEVLAGASDGTRPCLLVVDDPLVAVRVELHEATEARRSFAALGLERVDPIEGAERSSRLLEVVEIASGADTVRLDRAFVDGSSDLRSSAAFPLLVGTAVRVLSRDARPRAVAAVGEPLADVGELVDSEGRELAGLGAPLAAPRVGRYRARSLSSRERPEEEIEVALLDRSTTRSRPQLSDEVDDVWRGHRAPPELLSALVLGAICLLLVEWILYRRGRIP